MTTEKRIKGKTCRYYKAGWVWVSQDGSVIAYEEKTKNKQWGWPVTKQHYPRKRKASDGKMYVEARFGAKVMIDLAVITCWCKPMPKDGKKYMINHKDGDLCNNNGNNLEWVPYHYKHSNNQQEKIDYSDVVLTVCKDGTIKEGSKPISIIDYRFDPDMGLHFCPGPHACVHTKGHINGELVDVDELMRKAGYVQGDDADLKQPVILHIDYDWKNFNSDNLIFVEADDPLYIAYQQKWTESRDKRKIEIWKDFDSQTDEEIQVLLKIGQ